MTASDESPSVRPPDFDLAGHRAYRGVAWSGAYLLVSRASAVVAVPLILGHLGQDLYAAWVLAGALVMAQGLIDLGVAAALVRFVALAAAQGSRAGVVGVMVRSAVLYAGMTLAVAIALLASGHWLVSRVSYLQDEASAGVDLIRYAAAVFVMTNFALILAATLQGLDRVDAAFRSQTIGWLAYVPQLWIGLELGWGIHAVGLAWVVAFSLQIVLLSVSAVRGVRALPSRGHAVASLRDMLSLGGRWQVSAWADFATFQLPRVFAGLSLSSEAVVAVDLALRFSQVVVAPIFAFLPIVLPRATRAWARGGDEALRRELQRWYVPATLLLALGAAFAIPLAVPTITTWTGRPLTSIDPYVSSFIVVGVAAHASTGIFSSALLAVGRVRRLVVYKYQQLIAAVVLLVVGTIIGPRAVGASILIALTVPAMLFNQRSAKDFGLPRLVTVLPLGRVSLALALAASVTGAAVLTTSQSLPAWVVLLTGSLAACVASTGVFWLLRADLARLRASDWTPSRATT